MKSLQRFLIASIFSSVFGAASASAMPEIPASPVLLLYISPCRKLYLLM
jgi:hypothetical protein